MRHVYIDRAHRKSKVRPTECRPPPLLQVEERRQSNVVQATCKQATQAWTETTTDKAFTTAAMAATARKQSLLRGGYPRQANARSDRRAKAQIS